MSERGVVTIALDRIRAHPLNSNVMPERLYAKLKDHIGRTGRYPPLIVRPARDEPGAWQLLDGHHRRRALADVGATEASCVVWDVDDAEAMVLLATLNRLRGADDPGRRAALLAELKQRTGRTRSRLARLVPDRGADLKKLLALERPLPKPAAATPLADVPRAVHFFLLDADRSRLEAALARAGGPREQALMRWVQQAEQEVSDDE